MKKLFMAIAAIAVSAFAGAATVGWSVSAGSADYAGDSYYMFVIGQNGVQSVDAITTMLDSGADVSSYAFGSGALNANGVGSVTAAASGKTLEAGTYTTFMVLFDSASPSAGESKYALISGVANQTKVIQATTATVTFAAGNASTQGFLAEDKWQSYGGSVPEPTSGLLLLLGMAGLALKRKVA